MGRWHGQVDWKNLRANLFKEDGYIFSFFLIQDNPLIGVSHLWNPPYTKQKASMASLHQAVRLQLCKTQLIQALCKPGIELREIMVNMRNMLEIWRNMLEYVGKSWKIGGKKLEIGGKVVVSGSNICIFCQLPVNQRTET
jgi:hypothetical protein